MTNDLFTQADLDQMKQLGITKEEGRRQMAILEKGPRLVALQRPCTPGDGIVVLDTQDQSRLLALWEETAAKGRFSVFLPASGAATRMFAFLQRIRSRADEITSSKKAEELDQADSDYHDYQDFIKSLGEFAFYEPLAEVMARAGISLQERLDSEDCTEILDFLMEAQGLNYSSLPKGLIPFHRYSDHYRTALEEHLVEAIHTVRDGKQRCRLHFTVAAENEKEVKDHGRGAAAKYGASSGVEYELSFSLQSPATNTLALDLENRPFRRPDGSLLFRPGGHGALLQNLNRCQGDIVFIKNIDNVVTDGHRDQVVHLQRILAGMLLELQEAIFSYLSVLQSRSVESRVLQEVLDFAVHRLSVSPPEGFLQCSEKEKGSRLSELLNRPLRVCGMIKNRGEPGGGPFWVQEPSGGLSLQIVEYAQIDQNSPEQMAILGASTHFSPVQIVCGLRDFQDRPFDLTKFYDPQAVFISRKTEDGRELKALELPGLWNGGMAYWNTVFVEIPEETFNPVKTINDLLRPGHLTT
ncbi:MAG: DUF4301 family protein [Syntrophobacteria bacterium]